MTSTLPITITHQLPPSRWPEYKALRLLAVQTKPAAFLETEEETIAAPDSLWQERLEASIAGIDSVMSFAVTDQDEVIGMTGLLFNQKQKVRHSAHIVSVFVHPKYQGQGIGKQLMTATIARAKKQPGIEIVRLDVMTTNTPAYNLYTSLGFKNMGINTAAIKMGNDYFDDYQMELWIQ